MRKLVTFCLFSVIASCSHTAADVSHSKAIDNSQQNFALAPIFGECASTRKSVNISTTDLNLTSGKAYFMMWASTVAYANADQIKQVVIAAGFTDVRFLDSSQSTGLKKSGFQGFVAVRPGFRLLVLRGSSEQSDWLANSIDTTRPGKPFNLPGSVHAGISHQFETSWPLVRKALEEMGGKNDPLFVTGHSLGGGLASLFGVKLAAEKYPLINVISFASPRVGDTDFAAGAQTVLGSAYYRLARPDDFIAKVPVCSENADLGAALATLGKSEESTRLKMAQFRQTRFAHAGHKRARI